MALGWKEALTLDPRQRAPEPQGEWEAAMGCAFLAPVCFGVGVGGRQLWSPPLSLTCLAVDFTGDRSSRGPPVAAG